MHTPIARRYETTPSQTFEPFTARPKHRLRLLVLCAGVAVGLLVSGSPSIADDARSEAVSEVAAKSAEADQASIQALLSEWFTHFDRTISGLARSSDRLAGRALFGEIGALARDEDRRMSQTTGALLSVSPRSAYELLAYDTAMRPSGSVVRVEARALTARDLGVDRGPAANRPTAPAAPSKH